MKSQVFPFCHSSNIATSCGPDPLVAEWQNSSVLLHFPYCKICILQLLQLKRHGFYGVVQSVCCADRVVLTRKFWTRGVGRWESYNSPLHPSLNWTLTTCFRELLHWIPHQSCRKPGWFDRARVHVAGLRFQGPNGRFLFWEREHFLRLRDPLSFLNPRSLFLILCPSWGWFCHRAPVLWRTEASDLCLKWECI